MLTCKDIASLGYLRIDSELPEELQVQVDRHLMQCRECAFEIRSIEQAKSMLKEALPAEPSAPEYRERTLAKLHEELADLVTLPVSKEQNQWALPFLGERSA